MDTAPAGIVCCIGMLALAYPAAFAEQEYDLKFSLLIDRETAGEAESEYLAVMERVGAVPSVEIDITTELFTDYCDAVVRPTAVMPVILIKQYPCGMDLKNGEYGWVAVAKGTARSADLGALLAVAEEMRPYAHELRLGEVGPTAGGWLVLFAGIAAAGGLGVLLYPRCSGVGTQLLLVIVLIAVAVVPYAVAGVMGDMAYTSLLDGPGGTPPG